MLGVSGLQKMWPSRGGRGLLEPEKQCVAGAQADLEIKMGRRVRVAPSLPLKQSRPDPLLASLSRMLILGLNAISSVKPLLTSTPKSKVQLPRFKLAQIPRGCFLELTTTTSKSWFG